MSLESTTVTNTPAQQVTDQTVQDIEQTGDGQMIGPTTTSKVGFFGSTPVAQQAFTASTITTTGVVTGGVFSTSTLTINFVTALMQIQAALINLGLIA